MLKTLQDATKDGKILIWTLHLSNNLQTIRVNHNWPLPKIMNNRLALPNFHGFSMLYTDHVKQRANPESNNIPVWFRSMKPKPTFILEKEASTFNFNQPTSGGFHLVECSNIALANLLCDVWDVGKRIEVPTSP